MKRLIIAAFSAAAAPFVQAGSIYMDDMSCNQTDFQPFTVSVSSSTGDNNSSTYNQSTYIDSSYSSSDDNRATITFSYQFGGAKPIDCNRLYNMALRQKEGELKLLERKLAAFENLEHLDWSNVAK